MTPEALLDNNLRLAETPSSNSPTPTGSACSWSAGSPSARTCASPPALALRRHHRDRVHPRRAAQRRGPDTNGIGFRLDRERTAKNSGRAGGGSRAPLPLSGLSTTVLDGPVELEAPVDLDALDSFPGALPDEDSERGGLFRHRRALPRGGDDGPAQEPGADPPVERPAGEETGEHGLVPLPRRQPPKLVSSHGKPVTDQRAHRPEPGRRNPTDPDDRATEEAYGSDTDAYGTAEDA
ncbi:protein of unknown function [Streptomyces murinus]|uniref:hypothetical protein n=1 Tax=Streptomyces murinus TaxID=33900 RepID=UPI003D671170